MNHASVPSDRYTRRSRMLLGLGAIALAACSSSNPPVSDLNSGTATPTSSSSGTGVTIGNDDDDDAGADASPDASAVVDAGADADAEAGLPPPPPSICNPTMTLGTSTSVGGVTGTTLRFAGISRSETTIAFLDGTTLEIADRADPSSDFGTAQTVSSEVASDSVAITSDGLHILAVSSDRKSFLVFDRDTVGDAFAAGDTSMYQNLEDDLAAGETLGDPAYIHDDDAFVYSIFGRTDDTVHYTTRISLFASYDPNGPLGWPELRAENGLYRHVTGVEDDLQTLFYWDEVSATEKLAHTDGTASVISTIDLGPAHQYAAASASCDHVYFGVPGTGLFFANAK